MCVLLEQKTSSVTGLSQELCHRHIHIERGRVKEKKQQQQQQ